VSVSSQLEGSLQQAPAGAFVSVERRGCSREFALLLHCCRPLYCKADRDRILPLLGAGLDWMHLLESANHHGATPFVYQRLAEAKLDRLVPAESWALIEQQFHTHLRHNLFLVGQLRSILEALDSAGIPAIPFKGPALATALWGHLGLRQCVDLDILVAPKHVLAAMEALHNLGYEPGIRLNSSVWGEHIRVASEMPLRKTNSEMLLELQWDIAPRCFAVEIGMNESWKRAAVSECNGMSVLSFAPEDLLLALCVHGWKHEWSRLIWVSDVARLIVQNPGLDWAAILARSKHYGVKRILSLGVSLAHELLGSPLPEAIDETAQADAELECLLQQARRGLGENRQVSYIGWHLFLLRARERWRDRIRHAVRFVFTPGVPELTAIALPRPLHGLYPVMRVLRLGKQLVASD